MVCLFLATVQISVQHGGLHGLTPFGSRKGSYANQHRVRISIAIHCLQVSLDHQKLQTIRNVYLEITYLSIEQHNTSVLGFFSNRLFNQDRPQ